ncbi:hypothetical protein DUZ99_10010 [Xylanibacillus composti]|nr:hypothetical protein [Xylanibacillus composti]
MKVISNRCICIIAFIIMFNTSHTSLHNGAIFGTHAFLIDDVISAYTTSSDDDHFNNKKHQGGWPSALNLVPLTLLMLDQFPSTAPVPRIREHLLAVFYQADNVSPTPSDPLI